MRGWNAFCSSWGPKRPHEQRILQTMVSGIPVVLGLRTRIRILMFTRSFGPPGQYGSQHAESCTFYSQVNQEAAGLVTLLTVPMSQKCMPWCVGSDSSFALLILLFGFGHSATGHCAPAARAAIGARRVTQDSPSASRPLKPRPGPGHLAAASRAATVSEQSAD